MLSLHLSFLLLNLILSHHLNSPKGSLSTSLRRRVVDPHPTLTVNSELTQQANPQRQAQRAQSSPPGLATTANTSNSRFSTISSSMMISRRTLTPEQQSFADLLENSVRSGSSMSSRLSRSPTPNATIPLPTARLTGFIPGYDNFIVFFYHSYLPYKKI